MSFRNRLTVFFIVLVILPMIVVAAVGFVLASDSEQGKTNTHQKKISKRLFARQVKPKAGYNKQ